MRCRDYWCHGSDEFLVDETVVLYGSGSLQEDRSVDEWEQPFHNGSSLYFFYFKKG